MYRVIEDYLPEDKIMKNIIVLSVCLASTVIGLQADAVEKTLNTQDMIVSQNSQNEVFIARGTEPFWNINVSRRGIFYTDINGKKLNFPYVTPLKAEGRSADLVRVYKLRGRNNTLIITKVKECSDGMSDQKYPYATTLILGNRVLEGCAERK
ncbi:hypothetical protein B6N60_00379 [Richelia sinica FACHB-800]|uniref:Uncharacterized protein n=1 Tax=Richelia sinica FACHB-800 TaxID=1357546 RepID=A0A975Y345_9NOST|nr:hypothetical protein [Richelia sinica]QXE21702.1 hypothetical protein B6N60_00379 [Richelia sinica FACHB-800]